MSELSLIVYLVPPLLFCVVAGVTLAVYRSMTQQKKAIRARLVKHTEGFQTLDRPDEPSIEYRRTKSYASVGAVDQALSQQAWARGLGLDLVRAGIPLPVGEYALVWVTLAVLCWLAGMIVSRGLVGALLGALLGAALPPIILSFRKSARQKAFERQLPEAIDLLIRALRSGYGVNQGLETIARELEVPIGPEFAQVLEEVSLGVPIDESLRTVKDRVQVEEMELLVTALIVQKSTGGSLAEALTNISRTVRERIRMKAELHAITTTPRVSGYVVAVLPVISGVMMGMMNQEYARTMFASPIGTVAIGLATILTLTGLFISHKLSDIQV